MRDSTVIIAVVTWIMGVVLASGWAKAVAFVIPFYAWYLVIERLMQMAGLV